MEKITPQERFVLTRADLKENKHLITVLNVDFRDFKESSISVSDFKKADQVFFIDGDFVRILKNRYTNESIFDK